MLKDQLRNLQLSSQIAPSEFYENVLGIANQELCLHHPNKHLYDMDNKRFGEVWAEKHIMSLDAGFRKAKADHHDLILDRLKVEVKASRANGPAKDGLFLYQRSLSSGTTMPFTMNYMHIFLDQADAFVFIAVWKDKITYYVMSNKQVRDNLYLKPYQSEHQMAITDKNISEFEQFRVEQSEITNRLKMFEKTKG
jgi:hypothetical protein